MYQRLDSCLPDTCPEIYLDMSTRGDEAARPRDRPTLTLISCPAERLLGCQTSLPSSVQLVNTHG